MRDPTPPVFVFVVNPVAGGGRGGRASAHIQKRLTALNVPFRIVAAADAEDTESAAWHAAEGAAAVVAVGGDGTVHRVARGLIARGERTALGVLPAGTGNDFARALGFSLKLDRALEQLVHAHVHTADYGTVSWSTEGQEMQSTVFVNVAGAGFDAGVATEVAGKRWLTGLSGYALAALRLLPRWKSPLTHIVDRDAGDLGSARLFLLSVGNGFSAGGGFRLTPHASVFDGKLDVCFVEQLTVGRALSLLPLAIAGRHIHARGVRMLQTTGVTVRSASPLPVHADGEVLTSEAREVSFQVVPGGLRVLAARKNGPVARG